MIKTLLLSGALLFSPLNNEIVEEPQINENITEEEKEDIWNKVDEYLEDKDGNGRPDIIDEIFNKQLFGGLTVGLIVSLGIYIFSVTFMFKKAKRIDIGTKKYEEEISKLSQTFEEEKNKIINELTFQNEQTLKALDATTKLLYEYSNNQIILNNEIKNNVKEIEKITSSIDDRMSPIESSNKKIDRLLENQKMIANNSPEMISSGIAKILNEETDNVEKND